MSYHVPKHSRNVFSDTTPITEKEVRDTMQRQFPSSYASPREPTADMDGEKEEVLVDTDDGSHFSATLFRLTLSSDTNNREETTATSFEGGMGDTTYDHFGGRPQQGGPFLSRGMPSLPTAVHIEEVLAWWNTPTDSPFFWLHMDGVDTTEDSLRPVWACMEVPQETQRLLLSVEALVHQRLERRRQRAVALGARTADGGEEEEAENRYYQSNQQFDFYNEDIDFPSVDRVEVLSKQTLVFIELSTIVEKIKRPTAPTTATTATTIPLSSKVAPVYVLLCPTGVVSWSPLTDGHASHAPFQHTIPNWDYFRNTVVQSLNEKRSSAVHYPGLFLLHLLHHNCSLYLPGTSPILTDVDNVDNILPYISPEKESDQVDALRRVLLLRRKINSYKKYIQYKLRLLAELDKPSVHAFAAFLSPPPLPGRSSAGGPRYARLQSRLRRSQGQLQEATGVLANTTLLYSSTVVSFNNTASTNTDFYQLFISYVLIITLPLSVVASQWGMNCLVPFQHTDSTTPFWVITALMAVVALGLTLYVSFLYCGGEKKQNRLS